MNSTRTRTIVLAAFAALVVGVVLIVASSGGDEAPAAGSSVDRAFTAEMIPHHRSALEMAEIAKDRSERPEILRLADAIITSQSAEIGQMRGIDKRLAEAGTKPGSLGGGGMAMAMGDVSSLKRADPFDRAFVDKMIPHHQSAIDMARVVLDKGADPETKELATAIIDAQAKEIAQMQTYRKALAAK